MNWEEFTQTFELIGSTVKPSEDMLPMRLPPVFRRRGTLDECYLSIENDERDDPPDLVSEDLEWLTAQLEVRCDPPISPRQGHWLMQIRAEAPPQYVHKTEVPSRLADAYEQALANAERELERGNVEAVRKSLFFASRAHPTVPSVDPTAQLALIPLLRDVLPAEDLQFFIDDVKSCYQRAQIEQAYSGMERAHRALWERLRADPSLPYLGLAKRGHFLDRRPKLRTEPVAMQVLRELWVAIAAPSKHSPSWA